MTVKNVIDKVKEEEPNSFTDAKLISFINEVEMDVGTELRMDLADIPTYEDTTDSKNKVLLAPPPYDRLYVSYVKAMVDYANDEYPSYQLNQEQHVQDFRDYTDYVVREGKAEKRGMPRRFMGVW